MLVQTMAKLQPRCACKSVFSCADVCVCVCVYTQPRHLRPNQETLTQDYIRSMRLLQNTSRGVGDLILVYKRVSNLASHTGRVSELLEQVRVCVCVLSCSLLCVFVGVSVCC